MCYHICIYTACDWTGQKGQLQHVKALHKSQPRKSAPTMVVESVAPPQTTAVVTESLTKPSSSLQSSSNAHLADELVYTAQWQ